MISCKKYFAVMSFIHAGDIRTKFWILASEELNWNSKIKKSKPAIFRMMYVGFVEMMILPAIRESRKRPSECRNWFNPCSLFWICKNVINIVSISMKTWKIEESYWWLYVDLLALLLFFSTISIDYEFCLRSLIYQ